MPINESWGVPALPRDPAQRDYVQALYHLTRALDPTRPAIGNDGWEFATNDIWGIHDYTPQGETLRERYGSAEAVARMLDGSAPTPANRALALPGGVHAGQPVLLTEFGGIGFAPAAGERWYGYGTVSNADEYLARYAGFVEAILACPTILGFCYTQFTDTAQETNGLLTADRQHKLDPARVRAINTAPSMAIPSEVIRTIQAQVGQAIGEPVGD